MVRGLLLALVIVSPLGCTVNALPGSTSTRLGAGDGGTSGGLVDLGPGGGDHGDGGGCGGGSVDLAGPGDGGGWSWDSGGGWDAGLIDFGGSSDGGIVADGGASDGGHGNPHDGGPHADFAR